MILSLFVHVDIDLALHQLCHFLGALLTLEEGLCTFGDDLEDGVVIVCHLGGGLDKLSYLVHLLLAQATTL